MPPIPAIFHFTDSLKLPLEKKIEYISHAQINKQRWDNCVEASPNGLIYAYTTYLDAMSPHWDALVFGDYEAIMPLTWRRKMGIRYLCQPAFSQQLGIFYTDPLLQKLVPDFLRKTSLQFRLIEVYLNQHNYLNNCNSLHTNYLLSLKANYTMLHSGYKTDLLKNLKRTEKFNLQYCTSNNVALAIDSYEEHYGKRMNMKGWEYEHLNKLALEFMKEKKAFVREVRLENGSLLAIGLFFTDKKRIYNLASTTLANGRTLEANHFLFDNLIREFAGSGLTLDFEGSDLPGVARFYEKFGPRKESYFFWKSNRLPAVMRWWKR